VRVSQVFGIGKSQPSLDFVDVHVDTDTAIFVDPSALRGLDTVWGAECRSLLQHFFGHVLDLIQKGSDQAAINLLASLQERNEFHLGFSVGTSRGRGFGSGHAGDVWAALTKSRAAQTGLLQDLEDTCLLIEGIGPDMVSDAVCNIIRGPLIRYTQDMCLYCGIPMEQQVASGPIWNPTMLTWDEQLIELPVVDHHRLLLVPKAIARVSFSFSNDEYFRHYLLPRLQAEELQANTGLVQVLKDGRRRVTKRSLVAKYGAGKLVCVDLTIPRPNVLDQYRDDKRERARTPMTHDELAEAELTAVPDWDALLQRVIAVVPGNAGATEYENAVEALLTALFYPALLHPFKQHPIHQGRKRVDITYTNAAVSGFFHWIGQHYPSSLIFVECKNYGREIGNPELDQLSGRFSPNRGKVGLLICRSLADADLMVERCRDTAADDRGFALVLDDVRLAQLVDARRAHPARIDFDLLRQMFMQLIA
jgi:hypothetical protein